MELASLVDVVNVSCVLHNICELQKDKFMSDWEKTGAFEDAIVAEPIYEIEALY